ncbi:MAG: hypothetical protein JXR96_26995 [Deltaproteobacteria bacterium]|nr:hypothetical protein [Deltaproteobacteria bacterium]
MTVHETKRGKGEARLSPRRAAAALRAARALELRASGLSYDQIARELGFRDHSGAHRAVAGALERAQSEPAEECRQVELDRLDRLLLAHWKKRAEPEHARIILSISERRSRLLGLDRLPPPVAPSGDWFLRTELHDGAILVVPPDVDPADGYRLYLEHKQTLEVQG